MVKAKQIDAPLLEREQIQAQVKPLSNNGFKRFFQKIGRGWLTAWYGFSDRRPGFSKLLYTAFFFIAFSMGVTVLQLIMLIVLPPLFGETLASSTYLLLPQVSMGYAYVMVPAYARTLVDGVYEYVRLTNTSYGVTVIPQYAADGVTSYVLNLENYVNQLIARMPTGRATYTYAYFVYHAPQTFAILGSPLRLRYVVGLDGMQSMVGGGDGYFAAVLVATFIAQVINFPLQRNITFRSKGNPVFQAFMYLIGWILIQPFTMSIGSLWRVAVANLTQGGGFPQIVVNILDMVIIGGVSMIIFFFIFMVIFPNRDKVAKKAQAKLDAAKAKGVTGDQLAKLEAKNRDAQMRAKMANADKTAHKSKSQASAKAMAFFAAEKAYEKATADLEAAKAVGGAKLANAQYNYAMCKARVPEKHQAVSNAAVAKEQAAVDLDETTAEFNAYKQELGLSK